MHWRLFFKVLVLSAFISAVVASLFLYPIGEAGHVAAWVQAVGSIAAIAGAVYAGREGVRASARLKKEQFRRATLVIISAFVERVEAINVAASQPYEKRHISLSQVYAPSSLDGYLRALDAVPVLELPSPEAVSALLELQRLSKHFVSAADALDAGVWKPSNPLYEKLIEASEKWEDVSKYASEEYPEFFDFREDRDSWVKHSYDALRNKVNFSVECIKNQVKILHRELD